MLFFSNCKINIGLHITGKRDDGFHNLETIFFPVPLYDVIELSEASETTISILGNTIPGNSEDNIILKAWHLLKRDYHSLPPVHFHLLKNTPIGAGLGAGSANGAYTLIALNQTFQLGINTVELKSFAFQLGSDCPFFIENKPSFATGRGELLEEIDLNLSGYKIMLVNPGIHISTPWAFSRVTPAPSQNSLKQFIKLPVQNWKNSIANDFEPAVIRFHPEIGSIKEKLYEAGACFALMSGSGSTVYGFFEKTKDIQLDFPGNYFVRTILLN